MTFDETRDNLTDTEDVIMEADAREAEFLGNSRHIRLVESSVAEALLGQRHFGGSGNDPQDPEHDPIGDADTEYDIEYDDEPEDDGQPSEYTEWQDYMGGDEYYDHSENECW
jgi:hypothetical protein